MPYTRTRETIHAWNVSDYLYGDVWKQNHAWVTSPSVQRGVVDVHNVTTTMDSPTPKFYRRRNKGEVINTPFSKVIRDYTHEPKRLIIGRTDQKIAFRRDNHCATEIPSFDWASPALSDVESMEVEAITKARRNALTGDAMTLVTMGEARETIAYLWRPAERLRDGLLEIAKFVRRVAKRKGGWAAVKKDVEELHRLYASAWLQYRYAIMPIIYDIEAHIKASNYSDKPVRQTFRGSVNDTTAEIATGSSGPFWWGDVYTETVEVNMTISVRAGVLADIVDDLRRALSLNWYNVPEAAWELTRLSFVVDWLVNVGDYLGQLAYVAALHPRAEWVTTRVIRTEKRSQDVSGSGKCLIITDSSGCYNRLVTSLTRRKPVEKVSSGLRIRNNMSWKRYLDAIALLPVLVSPFKNLRKIPKNYLR